MAKKDRKRTALSATERFIHEQVEQLFSVLFDNMIPKDRYDDLDDDQKENNKKYYRRLAQSIIQYLLTAEYNGQPVFINKATTIKGRIPTANLANPIADPTNLLEPLTIPTSYVQGKVGLLEVDVGGISSDILDNGALKDERSYPYKNPMSLTPEKDEEDEAEQPPAPPDNVRVKNDGTVEVLQSNVKVEKDEPPVDPFEKLR